MTKQIDHNGELNSKLVNMSGQNQELVISLQNLEHEKRSIEGLLEQAAGQEGRILGKQEEMELKIY